MTSAHRPSLIFWYQECLQLDLWVAHRVLSFLHTTLPAVSLQIAQVTFPKDIKVLPSDPSPPKRTLAQCLFVSITLIKPRFVLASTIL